MLSVFRHLDRRVLDFFLVEQIGVVRSVMDHGLFHGCDFDCRGRRSQKQRAKSETEVSANRGEYVGSA